MFQGLEEVSQKCPKCNSTHVERDEVGGNWETVCLACGHVLEGPALVYSSHTKGDGGLVQQGTQVKKSSKPGISDWGHQVGADVVPYDAKGGASYEKLVQKTKCDIRNIINQLDNIHELGTIGFSHQAPVAVSDSKIKIKRDDSDYGNYNGNDNVDVVGGGGGGGGGGTSESKYYDLIKHSLEIWQECYDKDLTIGHRRENLLPVVIYIACRKYGYPYLLIDFCSIQRKCDVFTLARLFYRLVRKLEYPIKWNQTNVREHGELRDGHNDPTIYIERYIQSLRNGYNFENKEQRMCELAIHVVSSMQKDSIMTGRHPNGIYGAAILIASRVMGVGVSMSDICKICLTTKSTIEQRVKEFKATPSAKMSLDDFKEASKHGNLDANFKKEKSEKLQKLEKSEKSEKKQKKEKKARKNKRNKKNRKKNKNGNSDETDESDNSDENESESESESEEEDDDLDFENDKSTIKTEESTEKIIAKNENGSVSNSFSKGYAPPSYIRNRRKAKKLAKLSKNGNKKNNVNNNTNGNVNLNEESIVKKELNRDDIDFGLRKDNENNGLGDWNDDSDIENNNNDETGDFSQFVCHFGGGSGEGGEGGNDDMMSRVSSIGTISRKDKDSDKNDKNVERNGNSNSNRNRNDNDSGIEKRERIIKKTDDVIFSDDDEINNIVLSDSEVKIKKVMFSINHPDWDEMEKKRIENKIKREKDEKRKAIKRQNPYQDICQRAGKKLKTGFSAKDVKEVMGTESSHSESDSDSDSDSGSDSDRDSNSNSNINGDNRNKNENTKKNGKYINNESFFSGLLGAEVETIDAGLNDFENDDNDETTKGGEFLDTLLFDTNIPQLEDLVDNDSSKSKDNQKDKDKNKNKNKDNEIETPTGSDTNTGSYAFSNSFQVTDDGKHTGNNRDNKDNKQSEKKRNGLSMTHDSADIGDNDMFGDDDDDDMLEDMQF